jgi:surface carbohydrate biosynthesis protein (TIGR04326 family)
MGSSILPGPDQILVNGTSSRDLLIENGLSSSKVKLVEALRYLYLLDVTRRVTDTVVILADFKESINARLLRICSSALEKGSLTSHIKVRSHPIFPLTSRHLGRLSDCLTTESLGELLSQASVVITTAASSSAADCVSLGIPTILVADPTSLNYSPFRMSPLVTTVDNVDQLLEALQRAKNDKQRHTSETFCLDPDLPRWREEFKN